MTVKAGPVMRYMEATASMLNHPHVYVEGVLGTEPVPHAPDASRRAAPRRDPRLSPPDPLAPASS